jgi:mannose-6-phosphate isomerase-like protein (cupin superfamily)
MPDRESTAAPARGQRHLSLQEPGWTAGPGGQGRFTVLPLGDDEHGPLVAIVEYAPGVRLGVHHHDSDYCSIVVAGEVEITRRMEQVGSIRLVRAGTAYGPLVVGPEGCTVVEIFEDRTTFTKPVYLKEVDRAAAAASPMPELVRQIVAGTWADGAYQ